MLPPPAASSGSAVISAAWSGKLAPQHGAVGELEVGVIEPGATVRR